MLGFILSTQKEGLLISLTKAIAGSMKWYTGHTFTDLLISIMMLQFLV